MLTEKGYVFGFDWKTDQKRRRIDLPAWRWMMAHDPEGTEWSKHEVLVIHGQLYATTPAKRVTPAARAYFGDDIPVWEGDFRAPFRRGVTWRTLGLCTWIWYDRVGEHEGPFKHPFDLEYSSGFPKLSTATIDRRTFYRLELGPRAVLDERGFVKP